MKKKKKNKKTKYIMIILVVCIALLLILATVKLSSNRFTIEDRKSNIQKENQKDVEGQEKTIGWVRVQGTNIDYPVLILETDDAQITKESFAWIDNNDDKFYQNMTILGHNLYNLSSKPKMKSPNYKRFEELMNFVYKDFAEKNQMIQFTIDNEDHLYQIYAVSFIDEAAHLVVPYRDMSNKRNGNFIKYIKEESIYDYDIDVSSSDNVLNLSTCTRMFGTEKNKTIIVSAKEVDKSGKSKITINDNYDKVNNKLKGSVSDE